MDIYEVRPVKRPINIIVEVPGSKSITNRAILMASMADGKSKLSNVLFSEDSRNCLISIENLGYYMEVDEAKREVIVVGGLPKSGSRVNVGSAGTTARFLTALLAVKDGEFFIDASEQMKKRPMKPLLDILIELGCKIEYVGKVGYLPIILNGINSEGGDITLRIESSSQFLSALLMSGCYYKKGLNIQIEGKEVAHSYVDITLRMMKDFGVQGQKISQGRYSVKSNQKYKAIDYKIEPDVSSACYFYAMATITGGSVVVKDIHYTSMQGDIDFLKVLEKLGCSVSETSDGLLVKGPNNGVYEGIDIDMNDFSDQTMTLSTIAVFATSPTRIRNIEHIRHQESDRITATIAELTKMGIKCDETVDGITIYPGIPIPTIIETYDDHRIAMAFSLIGLRTDGIKISNPKCCAKTFENYFELLDSIINEHR